MLILSHSITMHDRINQLIPYSRLVSFLVHVRGPFMRYFNEYRSDFKGIDAEALFVGTIMHGLDHTMLEFVLQDPMWIRTTNPKLPWAELLSRIILIGFNRELRFLPFNRKYSNAEHPFFRRVYEAALLHDHELAGLIDTCICK
jgi:hypothetical protein